MPCNPLADPACVAGSTVMKSAVAGATSDVLERHRAGDHRRRQVDRRRTPPRGGCGSPRRTCRSRASCQPHPAVAAADHRRRSGRRGDSRRAADGASPGGQTRCWTSAAACSPWPRRRRWGRRSPPCCSKPATRGRRGCCRPRPAGTSPSGWTTSCDLGGGAAPAVVLIFGVIAIIFALVQAVLMLFRQAALIILAGALPLAAAGAIAPMTRTWVRKVTAWMLALICYKPAAAAVYAAAFTMIGSGGSPRTALMGFAMLRAVGRHAAGPDEVLHLDHRFHRRRRRRRADPRHRCNGRGRGRCYALIAWRCRVGSTGPGLLPELTARPAAHGRRCQPARWSSSRAGPRRAGRQRPRKQHSVGQRAQDQRNELQCGNGEHFCRCRPDRRGQRQPEPSGTAPVQLDSPMLPEVPPPLAPQQQRGRQPQQLPPGHRQLPAARAWQPVRWNREMPNDARPDASAHVRRMAAQPQHRTARPRPYRHLHHARLRSGPARRGRRLVPGAPVRGAADGAGRGRRA